MLLSCACVHDVFFCCVCSVFIKTYTRSGSPPHYVDLFYTSEDVRVSLQIHRYYGSRLAGISKVSSKERSQNKWITTLISMLVKYEWLGWCIHQAARGAGRQGRGGGRLAEQLPTYRCDVPPRAHPPHGLVLNISKINFWFNWLVVFHLISTTVLKV